MEAEHSKAEKWEGNAANLMTVSPSHFSVSGSFSMAEIK